MMLLNANQVIADRYEIVEKLGVGGMAIVYMAKDLKLDRHVTFKVLKEEHLTDEFVFSKFNTEARAAASLSHQNIVSVYDVGVEDNIHYIVMEYIDGITLKELIKMQAPFQNEEALGVAIQIAQALTHAHANKIVHQDIKPQNILVTNEGIIKVTDFGIASAQMVTSTTTTTSTVGSVHYFSPEQARGRFVDHRSDIYSLGIVIYEMMTGKIPFEGDSSVAIALKHINEPLPEITEPGVSEAVINIINKSTQKLSNQRYPTTEKMIEDLKAALTAEALEAKETEAAQEAINPDISPTIILDAQEQAEIEEYQKNIDNEPQTNIELELEIAEIEEEAELITPGNRASFDIFSPAKEKEEAAPFKKIEKKLIFVGIGFAVVISFAIIAIILMELWPEQPVVENDIVITIPNFLALTMEQAEEHNQTGIVIEQQFGYNEVVEIGLIFEQYPLAGTEVAASDISSIIVTVSQGASFATFIVPNFVGSTLLEAQGVVAPYSNITLQYTLVHSDIVPLGTIVAQTTAPNVVLEEGVIVVQVSQGSETGADVIVPNVLNLTQMEAMSALVGANLIPSATMEYHSTVPPGYVISQSLPVGFSVNPGTPINLIISQGPAITDTEPETESTTQEPESTPPPPEPEPTPPPPEPEPTPPPPPVVEEASGVVVFHLPGDIDTQAFPNIALTATVGGVTVFDSMIPAANFPFPITIQGPPGEALVQFFLFGEHAGQQTVVLE
ncbi:MAG: Stk1 family PASTA domain-containing Ser/Thr kinase [Defluviitaleaceae bacterium]|nr:Stk1 family PASTA domain-containing Ser/Thr kinase [Defluviitaleaceae bacterium]